MANPEYKVQIETKKNNGNSIINHVYTSDEFPDVGTAVMIYKSENRDSVNQEPSSIYSVIVFSFGIGLLLSGEFAQGIGIACVGIVIYFKFLRDYSRFITQSNDLERKRIISEISAAKGVILLHEARKQEMELKLNPSELTNWMLSQKNISDMWQKKIEELESRLSKIP